MLHVDHAAENRENPRVRANVPESPGCKRRLSISLLQSSGYVFRRIRQPATLQRLHDYDRDVPLVQLFVKIFCIHVPLSVSMLPVIVIHLNLHEIIMVRVGKSEQGVELRLVAMERESQLAYSACLSLFHQEIHHSVIHVADVESIHSASSDGVEEIEIDVVGLQVLEGVLIHL